MLKDYLIALSMANLWLVDIWKLFLVKDATAYPYYHWKINVAPLLLATMLDVLLLSALLWLAITLARRSHKQSILRIARLVFVLLFVLLALNLLIVAMRDHSLGPLVFELIHKPQLLFDWQGSRTLYSWLAAIGTLVGWVGITLMMHSLIYRRQQLIRVATAIALITSPFVLVTFAQAGTQWIRYRSGDQFQEHLAAPSSENAPNRRIVWIILDELDFRLSFYERPSTIRLPEFDKLRYESIFASNAYPPSNRTELSMPALISGRLVSRIKRTAPNELYVEFGDNSQAVAWSSEPNVFSRTRIMGLNTGLAGWYHPYCRVIGSSLSKCSWEASSLLFLANSEIADLICCSNGVTVSRAMLKVAQGLLFPQIVRLLTERESPSTWRHYSINELNGIRQAALTMVRDSNLHLLLVHYPIPHPLGIYDRHKNDFSLDRNSGYLDNLALADRVLGQLRQSLVEGGVWDSTTVLISSDHALQVDRVWKDHLFWKPSFTNEDPVVRNRPKDERVPFILRLAGQTKGFVYEPAFNTVLSHDLILAILSGEISNPEQAVAWLDSHRSIAESPYMPGGK